MWIFTSKSFLSVVSNKENQTGYRLLVLSRIKGVIEEVFISAYSGIRSLSAGLTPKPRSLIEERRVCRISDMICFHLNKTKDAAKWLSRMQLMKSKVGLDGYKKQPYIV